MLDFSASIISSKLGHDRSYDHFLSIYRLTTTFSDPLSIVNNDPLVQSYLIVYKYLIFVPQKIRPNWVTWRHMTPIIWETTMTQNVHLISFSVFWHPKPNSVDSSFFMQNFAKSEMVYFFQNTGGTLCFGEFLRWTIFAEFGQIWPNGTNASWLTSYSEK